MTKDNIQLGQRRPSHYGCMWW